MRGWRRVILLLAAPANPWFPGATAFNALSRWESRLTLAQLQLVAVATDLLPLISPRRHPGHPDRSAVGSRLSQGGEGPPRVPEVSSRLDGRVIRRSKLGAGRSDSER